MMEKVRDKFLLSVSELSVNKARDTCKTDVKLLNTTHVQETTNKMPDSSL